MFSWKDYDENSCLFLEGRVINVAILRHKDFRLTDSITGSIHKIKEDTLDEAKAEAEKFLKFYWGTVKSGITEISKLIDI